MKKNYSLRMKNLIDELAPASGSNIKNGPVDTSILFKFVTDIVCCHDTSISIPSDPALA